MKNRRVSHGTTAEGERREVPREFRQLTSVVFITVQL